jgi:predicted amidophosphoribosyltransferase
MGETLMTALLEQALAEVHKLPPDQQDAIATLILEELTDEASWDRAFDQSQDALARLAATVRVAKRSGSVKPLGFDEL